MIARRPSIVAAMLCCLLAVAVSDSVEAAWLLWSGIGMKGRGLDPVRNATDPRA